MNLSVKSMVRSGLLLAIAVVIQFLGKNIPQVSQLLVGPIINALLLIAVFAAGMEWGVFLGILTPLGAWFTGQLAAPMAPFIPFIIIGNVIYVIFFGLLFRVGDKGKYAGYLIGSVLKFAFMYVSALKLIHLFKINLPAKVASKLVIMMGIPQLLTALAGGAIALILIEILRKRRVEI